MTTYSWAGLTVDTAMLSGVAGRGYLEPIIFNGTTAPRLFAYFDAAIAQAGIAATNAAASLTGSSTTSNSIGTGTKTWTTETHKAWAPPMPLRIKADSANYVTGDVVTYDSASGALVVAVTNATGAGTFTAWTVSLSGEKGATGATGTAGAAGADGAAGAPGAGSTINAAWNGSVITASARPTFNYIYAIKAVDNPGSTRADISLIGDLPQASLGVFWFYGSGAGGGASGWQSLATVIPALLPIASDAQATAGTDDGAVMTPVKVVKALVGRVSKGTRYSNAGTFSHTFDPKMVFFTVEITGAGQAGEPGYRDQLVDGAIAAGGHGGEIQTEGFLATDVSSPISLTVGAGGIGTNSHSGNPASGGDSSFGTYLIARGGSGVPGSGLGTAIGSTVRAGNGGVGGAATSNSVTLTSGSAGWLRGDSVFGITGGDGTPGASNSGTTASTVTGGAGTAATKRRSGGPGGGAARNLGVGGTGAAVGGQGGTGGPAGGGGGGGGGSTTPGALHALDSAGGDGGPGEVFILETLGG